jgi:hypothetical protein
MYYQILSDSPRKVEGYVEQSIAGDADIHFYNDSTIYLKTSDPLFVQFIRKQFQIIDAVEPSANDKSSNGGMKKIIQRRA